MKFLMFLFFLFLALWFAGLLLRATFSRWLRRCTEEIDRTAKEAGRRTQGGARRGREGEVSVETTQAAISKKVSRSVGDYVEFEEIEIEEVKVETKTDGER